MGAGHAHALYVHEHSVVHRLPAQVKVASTLAFIFLVAITPSRAFWAFAVYGGAVLMTIVASRIGARFVLVRLLGILPFVAFAFLIPFIGSGARVDVLGISLSREGLLAAWNIIAKAGIGASMSIVLAGTTEVPDILSGLNRLKVPTVLTSIAGFMVRYLELIVEEIGRVRVAMASRGYAPRWLWQARPIAASAGAMFIRSYERGERVHAAMLARGYAGSMPDLRARQPAVGDWLVGAILPIVGLVTTVLARVVT